MTQTTKFSPQWLATRKLLVLFWFALPRSIQCAPRDIYFFQSTPSVEAYDFVEVTLYLVAPDAASPFTDATVEGQFGRKGDGKRILVDGFCDSADGSIFRIRFMPTSAGDYSYSVTYHQGSFTKNQSGVFSATNGNRRGILRVDPQYRWHFIWEGTGEHYFLNGTTAYFLPGWRDEKIIRDSIDRLHRFKVNRMRVLLAGRSATFWGEPILPSDEFHICLNPWQAERPDDPTNPGFNYARFNIPHWQKYERILAYARQRDMVISVVFDLADAQIHPAALSEDEKRYFRYATARLAAYSNLTWDLGDDISTYRSLEWSHQMGSMLEQWDPYHHLATDHPVDNTQQDRTSDWFGFTSFQQWPRPLHEWMLNQRRLQAATGRIIPQTNEEYGYEDHYPKWSPSYPDGASAEADRRAAWEMSMAGTYQTTGETAKRGTGVWPDTGGGWVNGRGDDSMVMLQGYARMVDFFTSLEWWKAEPHDELVNNANFCLAEPGKLYVVYLPMGGSVTVSLEPGQHQAGWFNPRSGERFPITIAKGPAWTSPPAPDSGDWALLLTRTETHP